MLYVQHHVEMSSCQCSCAHASYLEYGRAKYDVTPNLKRYHLKGLIKLSFGYVYKYIVVKDKGVRSL